MNLHGVRILVTRPSAQARPMAEQIKALGGIAITVPMIRILPPVQWDACDAQIDRLAEFVGVVFTSSNAAKYFLNRCAERGAGGTLPGRMHVYAVGPKTARYVEHAGMSPAHVPSTYNGAELAAHFRAQNLHGHRYLLPRGDIGRDEIAEALRLAGAVVTPVIVYRTAGPDDASAARVRSLLADRAVDVVTFASPSAVEHFAGVIDAELTSLVKSGVLVGVIGGTTADAARRSGFPVHVIAGTATGEGLIEALVSWNPPSA